jgi:plasmid stabilization system protein ParE
VPARQVDYHWAARCEAIEAAGWYADRSEIVAFAFDLRLAEIERLIARFPAIGRPYLSGTRCLPLGQFPYLIVYMATARRLLVVAVAHAARRPGYWRERLRR